MYCTFPLKLAHGGSIGGLCLVGGILLWVLLTVRDLKKVSGHHLFRVREERRVTPCDEVRTQWLVRATLRCFSTSLIRATGRIDRKARCLRGTAIRPRRRSVAGGLAGWLPLVMDHLTTAAERQARWYAARDHDVWPRYLALRPATHWKDLLLAQAKPPEQHDQHAKASSSGCSGLSDFYDDDFVYSLPFAWLMESRKEEPTTTNTVSENNKQDDRIPPDLLRRSLETHGFVVVSNVLTTEECREALNLAWDWMEAASAAEAHLGSSKQPPTSTTKNNNNIRVVDRTDPSTHHHCSRDGGEVWFPRAVEGGLMPFYGAGHSSLAWKIRSHPAVQRVFAQLHQNHRLLSSLDGFVLWTEQQPPTDRGWFHVDQNPVHKPGAAAVQGLVNLIAVSPRTGGNVLVAQSHRDFANGHYCRRRRRCGSSSSSGIPTAAGAARNEHEEKNTDDDNDDSVRLFYEQRLREIGDDDWLEIDPNDRLLLHPQRVVSLLLGAGDLLLWDSRVAHCSYPARRDDPRQDEKAKNTAPPVSPDPSSNQGFLRAATLVSMVPGDSVVSERVLEERRKAVDRSRTLTHWVDKAAPLGEERDEQVALERACVDFIKAQQSNRDRKVLLTWQDLSDDQRRLVTGR